MSDLVIVAGSPSQNSRSAVVLDYLVEQAERQGLQVGFVRVRELQPENLVLGRPDSPDIQEAINSIDKARAVVIATPIYKAAYSGLLKVFLDLLPINILTDKIVLPIATGGSPSHLLAIDYALKPVLSTLGANHILNGIYILDSQIIAATNGGIAKYAPDEEIQKRLNLALQRLITVLPPIERVVQLEAV